MKCDNCANHQVHPSGTDDGYYTACKERFHTLQIVNPMTKEEKQSVMDGEKKSCRGFEKI